MELKAKWGQASAGQKYLRRLFTNKAADEHFQIPRSNTRNRSYQNLKKKCAKFYPPKFQEGNGFDHFFILSELNTGEQLSQNIVQERNYEQKIEGLIKH